MCLFINVSRHPDNKPIILDEDLKVFKYLDINKRKIFNTKYSTPFRHKNILFLFGKCILKAKLDEPDPFDSVFKGIHACINKSMLSMDYIEFKAIIPKGTKVYFGTDNDIVAEKLIIYKNKLR